MRKRSYRCKKQRRLNRDKCNAKLFVFSDGTITTEGEHICSTANSNTVVEVREVMEERVDEMALANLQTQPKDIWTAICTEMDQVHQSYTGLTREQVMRRVYRTRMKSFGGDVFRKIEVEPTCLVVDSDLYFLQFNVAFYCEGDLHRCTGWGNPKLLGLLQYPKLNMYLDCTFKCVPAPFYQCMIVMVYDHGTNMYVPVMYVLLTSKLENVYFQALHWVIASSDFKLDPLTVTCDFEKGLIKAVQQQFTGVSIVGCLFHFKQALRRKLLKLKIPDDEVSLAMRPKVLDVLTLIPHDEIASKGIPYVESILECGESYTHEKWQEFWSYFKKTWLDLYKPTLWNVNGLLDDLHDLSNRTNNPLERYVYLVFELVSY
jgi:MULE transposase domain